MKRKTSFASNKRSQLNTFKKIFPLFQNNGDQISKSIIQRNNLDRKEKPVKTYKMDNDFYFEQKENRLK